MIEKNLVPTVANSEIHILGEGPFWDSIAEELLWVDIKRGTYFTGKLIENNQIEIIKREQFENTVGAVASSPDGTKIVANGEVIKIINNGKTLETIQLINSAGKRRLNDGKPDPKGRYLVGSLSFDGKSKTEELFLINENREVTVIDNDLTLSNGLAWDSTGEKFYSIDTFTKKIFVRSYDLDSGTTGARSIFAEIKDGYPDGMCVDSENHLWVAIWGQGEVIRFAPDGSVASKIEVPAPHTTSVCFAGKNLDLLIITTASDELSSEQIAEYPMSGAIFAVVPGVTGLPQSLWGGFTA